MSRTAQPLLGLPIFVWRLIFAAALAALLLVGRPAGAQECACEKPVVQPPVYQRLAVVQPQPTSWIFSPGRYTHDPATGARVAQYQAKPSIEPLDDPRLVTSGYTRSRTVLRGADGSADTIYRVQSFGNGRGGLDAEWERFHDAWRGSTAAAGYMQGGYGYPGGYGGYGGGYGYPGGYGGGYGGYGGGYGGGFGFPGAFAPGLGLGVGAAAWGPYGYRPNLPPYYGFGPGYGQPDPGRLDPDGADGYPEQFPYVPDRQFFNGGLPPFSKTTP